MTDKYNTEQRQDKKCCMEGESRKEEGERKYGSCSTYQLLWGKGRNRNDDIF